ncbi:MAG TPA: TIGR02266 family protein [Thermodesulfobacteriota bacterium]|nr:TIGR02266 family protein [Thermodesulfobacteriota bacterium]
MGGKRERRRTPRIPIYIKVDYKVDLRRDDAPYSDYSANINRDGLFLRSDRPLAPGTLLNLQFALPEDSRVIKVNGRVVWITRDLEERVGGRWEPGMGIEFEDVGPEVRELIDRLVERWRRAN